MILPPVKKSMHALMKITANGAITRVFLLLISGKDTKNLAESNFLPIEGLPKIDHQNVLSGSFINLEYRIPNGSIIQFLDDHATYLDNQLPCEFGGHRCFDIVANMNFLLVCTYDKNGKNMN